MKKNDELWKKLEAYAISKDWQPGNETIFEILVEADRKKEYGHDEHRWFTLFSVVVQVGEIFIDFQTYQNSGDEPAFNGDEYREMVFDSAVEVFPFEVTVTDYKTKQS